MSRPEVIAHRGLPRQARENTLASFALAVDAGADGIELDVHASRDGVVVVHHDPCLPGAGDSAPGTHGPAIASLSLTELRRQTVGGADVPTLREVIASIHGRARIYVEIKGRGIEELVVREIADGATECSVHSFDHRVAQRVRGLAPGLSTGILGTSYLIDPVRALEDAGARDYWQQFELIDDALVAAIHGAGGRVVAWTANIDDDVRRLARLGVDAICTDVADRVRQLLAHLD